MPILKQGESRMTRPRASLVSVADRPYYHCSGRCVRHAFLRGDDPLTGRTFDHRKTWIVERLKLLAEVFAIDLCAYAVMSNHYPLVVRLDPDRMQNWTDLDVAERWTRLFSGPDCVPRYLKSESLNDAEQPLLAGLSPKWRSRLADLSWFMRCLNETIARHANLEDPCTGHFWEGRFTRAGMTPPLTNSAGARSPEAASPSMMAPVRGSL